MLSAFRQPHAALRLLWLAALLLACVWQPALKAAGEVHEAIHLLTAGVSHSDGHAEHLEPLSGDPGTASKAVAQTDSGWDALLHAAHCCAHPAAVPLAIAEAPRPIAAVGPRPALTQAPASIGEPPLLRPPIRV